MKKNNHVIEVGQSIRDGKAFEKWLINQGYEIDAGRSDRCFVDGEDVTESMEAAEIWQELWNQFKGGRE